MRDLDCSDAEDKISLALDSPHLSGLTLRESRMHWSRIGYPLLLGILLLPANAAADEGLPAWLPRYDLAVRVDVAAGHVDLHQQVTWTNRHERLATEIVFNA